MMKNVHRTEKTVCRTSYLVHRQTKYEVRMTIYAPQSATDDIRLRERGKEWKR